MDGNNGNKVTLYSCFGAKWQKWTKDGENIKNNKNGQCLGLDENGYGVYVTECNGSNSQKWQEITLG